MSSLKFENDAEAVACVATLMVAADGVGTDAEVHFLFDRVSTIPVFADYDAAGFRRLVGHVSELMQGVIEQNEDGSITDAGIDTVGAAVAAAVDEADWPMVLKVAEAVARSDGMEAAETRVLEHLAGILTAKA